VRPPLALDVLADPCGPACPTVDAVLCANMLHIAPWATCAALMQGAARHLAATGLLHDLRPLPRRRRAHGAGNQAFDADLRARCPQWGLRRLADVAQRRRPMSACVLRERIAMPANNLLLVWARTP
jgi:hypothetical protein